MKCDGETSVVSEPREEGREGNGNKEEYLAYRQLKKDQQKIMVKKVQEGVDLIAMYVFPGIFLFFNLCYWPYYLLL